MKAGWMDIAESVDMKFLDDPCHEIVIMTLKIAEFHFVTIPMHDYHFQRMLNLIHHSIHSVRLQAILTITSFLVRVPAEIGRADAGLFEHFARAIRKVGFESGKEIMFAVACLIAAVSESVIVDSPIPTLVPDFLGFLISKSSPRCQPVFQVLARIFETVKSTGPIDALKTMFREFLAENAVDDMPPEISELFAALSALLPPDQ
jgi:hypothetical protein